MEKATCSVSECERQVLSRGWCSIHYERWRRYGDPLYVRKFKKDFPCAAVGCNKPTEINGYCQMHDRRVKLHGSPEGRAIKKAVCVGPECDREVSERVASGLCPSHQRQQAYGKPLTPLRKIDCARPEFCEFPDCGRPHKSGGLCAAHVLQKRRGQELRPIRVLAPGVECSAEGCQRTRRTAGYCDRHQYSRVRRWVQYGLDLESGQAMYERQGRSCGVCQTPMHIDDLKIDHDHDCCNVGAKSCGNCVRGLLCGRCNNGLGYFRDNVTTLRNAANYLSTFKGWQTE